MRHYCTRHDPGHARTSTRNSPAADVQVATSRSSQRAGSTRPHPPTRLPGLDAFVCTKYLRFRAVPAARQRCEAIVSRRDTALQVPPADPWHHRLDEGKQRAPAGRVRTGNDGPRREPLDRFGLGPSSTRPSGQPQGRYCLCTAPTGVLGRDGREIEDLLVCTRRGPGAGPAVCLGAALVCYHGKTGKQQDNGRRHCRAEDLQTACRNQIKPALP